MTVLTSMPSLDRAPGNEPTTSARPPTFTKGVASAAANNTLSFFFSGIYGLMFFKHELLYHQGKLTGLRLVISLQKRKGLSQALRILSQQTSYNQSVGMDCPSLQGTSENPYPAQEPLPAQPYQSTC